MRAASTVLGNVSLKLLSAASTAPMAKVPKTAADVFSPG
jgi:hypothetical protein